jgi:hypothetical protein
MPYSRPLPKPINALNYCAAPHGECTRTKRGCQSGKDICKWFRVRVRPYANAQEDFDADE